MNKISNLNNSKLLIVGILATLIVFSLWTYAKAAGAEVSICVKHSGDSYVVGSGFAHQDCKNNEQLITFNVQGPAGPQGPQGPAGTPACNGVCQPIFSIDKSVYAPGESMSVTCSWFRDGIQIYDMTPGIDGLAEKGGNKGHYDCGNSPTVITLSSQAGHSYAVLQSVPADNSCSGQDYGTCASRVSLFGTIAELDFSVSQ